LQTRGVDGALAPHSTVEAAAAAYLREVNEIQPSGLVHLLGHSFGGWVALEMAYQLRAVGRQVASVTVIDSEVPYDDTAMIREYTAGEVLVKLVDILEMSSETSLGIDMPQFETLTETEQLRVLHQNMIRTGMMPRNSRTASLSGLVTAFGAALRTTYRPRQQYPEQLNLILVSDRDLDEEANRRARQETVAGGKQWAPNLACFAAPGNHMTVLKRPHVQAIAKWWLTNVQQERT
jgi:thioesterase domain-containing protein